MAPFIPQSESAAAPGVSSDVSEEVSADDLLTDEDSEARWGQGIGQHQGIGKGKGKGGKPTFGKSIEVCNNFLGEEVWVATMLRIDGSETVDGWTVIPPDDCQMVVTNYTGPGELYARVEDLGGLDVTSLPLPVLGCIDRSTPSFLTTELDLCLDSGQSFQGFARHPNTSLWTIDVP
ncbi:DUF1036 domain-containing protein [Nannocystis punicea]|uniref:DUF1036 domain-containing protein n=1 Tax=Nannocystis punicea TaxID=2995304 RepID=A0ABY7H0Z5_9BACT|nr:DUF1036 domain-containing protein [Nannocystis poenicansa]WAS92918.1 DUF1036 domain-containing protein [Nannocystis poenicansa]